MRLVIFCHLFLATTILTSAHAQSENTRPFDSDEGADRVIAAQINSYKKAPRKYRKPRFVRYKSIRSAKFRNYKVTQIPQYEIPPLLTREDLNKIIPSNVTANDPSQEVLKKMGDKAVNVWLKSSAMQSVSLVQAAQKVEQAMKAEVNLAPEDSEVKHKLNFQVQAFQATSKVDYTGYVDATVSYNVRDQKAGYEVRRKVLHNKDLFMNHTQGKDENLSSVGLKWAF